MIWNWKWKKMLFSKSSKYSYFKPIFNYTWKGFWKGTLIHQNYDTLVCFCLKKEFSQPISKKKGRPTNVGGKGKKPKRVATKNEIFFAKSNEEKKMVWSGKILRCTLWLKFGDKWMQNFPRVPKKKQCFFLLNLWFCKSTIAIEASPPVPLPPTIHIP